MDCGKHYQKPSKKKKIFIFHFKNFIAKIIHARLFYNQKILIALNNVNIDCSKKDVLTVYNSDRIYMLYDYCMNKKNDTGNFVMAKSKYLIIKLKSSTPKLLSFSFDLVYFDSAINENSRPPSLTTQHFVTNFKEKQTSSIITQDGKECFFFL